MTIIDLLATSGRPPDLECIRSMCSHLPVYFGVAVTPDVHTVVIAALLRQGYIPLAQEWIQRIPELPPATAPTVEHFHTFLRNCPQHVQPTLLRDLVSRKMRRAGVRPNNETFSILVRCLINNATQAKTLIHPETFISIIVDMKLHRLPSDPSVLSLISEYYLEHGFQVYAEDIRKTYAAQFPEALTPEEQQRYTWRKQLSAASQTSGVKHSLEVFRRSAAEGCTATPDTIRAILASSKSIEDIREVEEALGVQADVSAYAVLVNNNIRIKKVQDALAVYEEAKKSGIVPVAGLVAPILRSLSSAERKMAETHNANLDSALAIYSDLDEAFPAPAPDSPEALTLTDHTVHSDGPDIDVYTSLLRGLSLSSNIKTAYPIAQALLYDMKSRGITATGAVRTSIIILDMRNCDNLDAAYKVYNKARSELTEVGYLAVLHAFSRMSQSMGHPDLLEYYFQIVRDMRLAGFRITDRVYTDILQQFAEIAASVRQVHNLVSLDSSIQPERIVWNQLMNTYQRLGNFPEAYRVWETMYHTAKYGPIAVSIIFDACGYAGKFDIAKQIAGKLTADGYAFNLHNWNSYIECLCRLEQFSFALEVICTDMGTLAQPVKPDVSTITIMLKLAKSRIQTNIVLQRVRRHLPELWKTLPQNTEQPQDDNVLGLR
ncbi:hypothetical protein GGX14DRAFT_348847 [Mycena pura]|uniref:Pentatricopeptide repeat-containing protein n=1 Tax=Mycena pura TaxID=153505 RepID=A0AAD6YNZ6_9AGAR|nr:hypothetical protein GGX14DRAFT_348847 [Mycena pura]